MKALRLSVGFAVGLVGIAAVEHEARACGGCFSRPETPTVVTDHRMIFAVSPTQSTLYDQIEYTGAPSSFGWVLPISGTVTVGLSADVLFSTLDQQTQTQILPPPRNCPGPPSDCASRNSSSGAAGAAAPSENDTAGGVTVLKHQVVGPYDTVQLQANTPNALEDWLTQNGFNLPADVKPVVDQYQTEHFNFLAMKLVPGAGIQDMRPVRVTTNGANVALPLRMVAAGTGATVGITLWIVSQGRYEPQPQSFGSFYITNDEISWDWTQNKSTYTDVRTQKETAGQNKVWEIESSVTVTATNVQESVRNPPYNGGGPIPATDEARAQVDYQPVTDTGGAVTQTAVQVRDADLATLFNGINGTARVTRIRADLAHAALTADLVLQASSDQAELSNVRQITKEVAPPLCPVYQGCQQVGTAPRPAGATATSSGGATGYGGETFTCASGPSSGGGSGRVAAIFGLVAFALAGILRSRRK